MKSSLSMVSLILLIIFNNNIILSVESIFVYWVLNVNWIILLYCNYKKIWLNKIILVGSLIWNTTYKVALVSEFYVIKHKKEA